MRRELLVVLFLGVACGPLRGPRTDRTTCDTLAAFKQALAEKRGDTTACAVAAAERDPDVGTAVLSAWLEADAPSAYQAYRSNRVAFKLNESSFTALARYEMLSLGVTDVTARYYDRKGAVAFDETATLFALLLAEREPAKAIAFVRSTKDFNSPEWSWANLDVRTRTRLLAALAATGDVDQLAGACAHLFDAGASEESVACMARYRGPDSGKVKATIASVLVSLPHVDLAMLAELKRAGYDFSDEVGVDVGGNDPLGELCDKYGRLFSRNEPGKDERLLQRLAESNPSDQAICFAHAAASNCYAKLLKQRPCDSLDVFGRLVNQLPNRDRTRMINELFDGKAKKYFKEAPPAEIFPFHVLLGNILPERLATRPHLGWEYHRRRAIELWSQMSREPFPEEDYFPDLPPRFP